MIKNIKAVIFDFDGTITYGDDFSGALEHVYKKNKHNLGTVNDEKFFEINKECIAELRNEYLKGSLPLYQIGIMVWFRSLEKLKIFPKASLVYSLYFTFQKYLDTNIKVKEGVLETIDYLKKKKIKIGILSNGLFLDRYERVNGTGLINDFDLIIPSDITGYDKPDKRTFKHIVDIFGNKIEEFLYVGNDVKEDIKGALDYGFENIILLSSRDQSELGLPSKIIIKKNFIELYKTLKDGYL